MKYTRKWQKRYQEWGAGACAVAMVGLVILTVVGAPLESVVGWIACPPWVIGGERKREQVQHPGRCPARTDWRGGWEWLRRSWVKPAVRSEALLVLVFLAERWEWEWVCLLPWIAWVWKGAGVVWPGLVSQGVYRGLVRAWEEAGRIALVIFRAIMGQSFSPRMGQAFSPKLGHLFSAIVGGPPVGHSFSAKLGHDGAGETPLSRAYFRFSERREQEERCPERGKRPWRSERC
jgi:hypothetical protein